jgi:hypothetical protein
MVQASLFPAEMTEELFATPLGSMQDGNDLDLAILDAVNHDKRCTRDRQLTRSFSSWSTKIWVMDQLLDRRDKSGEHAVRRPKVVECDVVPDFVDLPPRLSSPHYSHEFGSSWDLPQTHLGGGSS